MRRKRGGPRRPHASLLVLLAALLARANDAACNYSLTLPESARGGESEGWCAPYASAGGGASAARCNGITVAPGAVLAFGTCALPGAACSGATSLSLRDASSDATLAAVNRVALNSSVAALSHGCVLGVRCSYGEWRNPSLTAAAVEVAQGCYGKASCAGVTAWQILNGDAALLPALATSATPALAFSVTAAQPASLTGLRGSAPLGATVTVWTRAGSPFAAGALNSSAGWTPAWNGTWSADGAVAFSTPLALLAGSVSGVLAVASAGGSLACAHALGTATDLLLSDGVLSVSQGGALAGAFAGGAPSAACAWLNLSLSYSLPTACTPSPAAPVPIPTTPPFSLVSSLDDLMRALANPDVNTIEVQTHIVLNGTELNATLGTNGTRTLVLEGTNACRRNNPLTPLCSISAGGASRVFAVQQGLQLHMGNLLLRDGVAPPGGFGGCALVTCANCSLALDSMEFRNCSAWDTAGGGLAVMGGSLSAVALDMQQCSASTGGALMVSGGNILLQNSRFAGNSARGSSHDTVASALSGMDLAGTAGGGAALFNVTGSIVGCAFDANVATTTDIVLLDNPATAQARGGGLFVAASALQVNATVFSNCTASYGGGVHVVRAAATMLSACALVDNVATHGSGGGMFAADCDGVVTLADSLVSGNGAGGRTGGGIAVMNASLTVARSALTSNAALDGCGGAIGLDAGATVLLQRGTVVSSNAALSGGGLCCNQCDDMRAVDSFLYDNHATQGSGGAVFSSLTPTTLVNTTLTGNSAPQGGAVSAVSAPLNVTDSVLNDNVATATHGGAVLHEASDDALQALVMTRTSLSGNTCYGAGGAVAAFWSASAVFSFCTFTNNSISAAAPTGGALMSLNVAALVVQNCTFSANWLTQVSELAENALLGYISSVAAPGTGCGGALWVGADGAMPASVLGTTFHSNWATTGGGIYITGSVRFTMRDSVLYHSHAYGKSSEGGGVMTDLAAVSDIYDTYFYSCEAVRGGAGWHGGASRTNYTRCLFEENEGKPGDNTKGSALYLDIDSSTVSVTQSTFLNNMGEGACQGTVAMARSESTHLSITDSLFDGNFAQLGGALLLGVYSQSQQLNLSGVTFLRNRAYIGGVMFSEADEYDDLHCSPAACNTSANTAEDYGPVMATPAKDVAITLPAKVRSGAPLPISVTLSDGFGQLVNEWEDLVVTITTDALLSGSLRTFYSKGAAVFPSLSLKGNESVSYELQFTVLGPNLFGNDVAERTTPLMVLVQPCEEGERFDADNMDCACANRYGLVAADHTCRLCGTDEVVPLGELSCETCPALSIPATQNDCACIPGYFGTIVGSTGACTQCPADTYRSALDPPGVCVPCAATSHTFALGATSETDCLCAAGHFNDRSGPNGSFACAPVPEGGWAPQADSRLFALAGWWRESPTASHFFSCAQGMCMREEVPTDANTTRLGYKCREGHTGHLCAVCHPEFAYQGVYCSQCEPGQRFDDWSPAQRGGVVVLGVLLLLLAIFLLFFLPLCPRVEAAIESVLAPAVDGMERALGKMTEVTRPRSAARSRATSSAERPLSRGHVMRAAEGERPLSRGHVVRAAEDAPRASRAARASARRSNVLLRRRSVSVVSAGESGDPDAPELLRSVPVQRPSRVQVFLDLIAEPIRIVVSFWQVVSSFSSNLYVPWPSLYYALSNSLNVVSLQFLRLPAISCISPEVSFLTVFNGVTISTLLFVVFCAATYYLGQRTAVARADPERKRRFKTRCLSVFIWGIFLVYPQVSSTTLLIFACSPLESGTSWLMADMRVQCWTPQHRMYVGIGVLWTLLFPFGIPVAFLFVLYRAKVPDLAAWKRDCAWLRALVQRAMILGARTDSDFDPETVTMESISLDHLHMLRALYLNADEPPPPAGELASGKTGPLASGKTGALALAGAQNASVRELLHGVRAAAVAAEADAVAADVAMLPAVNPGVPSATASVISRRGSTQILRPAAEELAEPAPELPAHFSRRPVTTPPESEAPPPLLLMNGDAGSHALPPPRQSSRLSRQSISLAAGLAMQTVRRAVGTVRLWRPAADAPPPPPFASGCFEMLQRLRRQLGRATVLRAKTMRRVMSTLIYKSERMQLLGSLLDWAEHDKQTLVSEPRANLMRWRTAHEWHALRIAEVHLGERDTAERAAFFKLQFLFCNYACHAWYWESVDLFQKLFLTSIIAFIAPHTAVQVIIAALFAFMMVMFTTSVKPYREKANNQLAALAQINLFLFLWTGLLLQTNPDGITENRLLFSIVVGLLTTSIVVFTGYLFVRELLWQLMAALREVDEEEDAEALEWDLADEAALAARGQLMSCNESDDEFAGTEDGSAHAKDGPWWAGTRAKLAAVACFTLVLGLGLGLGLRSSGGGAPALESAVTRFTLVIAHEALPGHPKELITVNGSSPGPTLRVPFGHRLEVTVINHIEHDATAVHWHGMTQRGTPYMDGVVGLTQCPIPSPDAAAPDANRMVYSFTPDRPGTFWYHGHYNAQYPDGLYGALIIEDGGASMAGARQGNESAAYDADTDEWIWQAADWYDASSVALLGAYLSPDSDGEEPVPDAIVVNGLRSDGALALRTSRTQRQLVRFINTAAFSMWRVSVDGMPLILVELDGTAVEPLEVPFLEVNVAQRAAFVLDWSRMHADVAASPAIWFRVQAMPHMYRSYDADLPDLGLYGSSGGQPFNINWAGLIRFEEDAARAGAAAMPSYETPPAFESPPADMNLQAARSWPPMPAPPPTHQMYIEFAFAVDEDGITRGYINGDTAHMAMGAQLLAPELYSYASRAGGPLSDAATPLSGALHGSAAVPFVIPMDAVVDVLVNNTGQGDHPMHLHGHEHWVIASSDAPELGALYAPHYVRRDVVTAPSGGWAKFRFIADNPGTWMMHCHIDWHMHIGMIATFVEAPSELAMGAMAGKLASSPTHDAACAAQRASYEAREAPAASGADHGA